MASYKDFPPPPAQRDEGYRRRVMPKDLWQQQTGSAAPQENADGSASVADYFGNLEKFKRTENPAAEPSREGGYPKGHKV